MGRQNLMQHVFLPRKCLFIFFKYWFLRIKCNYPVPSSWLALTPISVFHRNTGKVEFILFTSTLIQLSENKCSLNDYTVGIQGCIRLVTLLSCLMCKQVIILLTIEVVRVVIVITHPSTPWLPFIPLHCRTRSCNDLKYFTTIGIQWYLLNLPRCCVFYGIWQVLTLMSSMDE